MLLLLPTALLLERRQWWAIALPLLPWLGPPAYPPVFLLGLIGPLLTRRLAAARSPATTAVRDATG